MGRRENPPREENPMTDFSLRPTLTAVAAVALVAALAAGPAEAGKRDPAKIPPDVLQMEDILAKAKRDRPGRVVEVDLDRRGKRYIYQVEVIDADGAE
jgi:uncharacterized membrane protein YkoI